MARATIPRGTASTIRPAADAAEVDRPLGQGAEPLERHVVEVDDRDAVQVLDTGPQRDELQQVRDDLHVDQALGAGLDDLEHAVVLFERQGHVDLIDPLALADLHGLGGRAEQRQPAVAEVVLSRRDRRRNRRRGSPVRGARGSCPPRAVRARPRRRSGCASARCRPASGARTSGARLPARRTSAGRSARGTAPTRPGTPRTRRGPSCRPARSTPGSRAW